MSEERKGKERKGKKKLSMYIPIELHKELKLIAAERTTSVSKIVSQAILIALLDMNKYK